MYAYCYEIDDTMTVIFNICVAYMYYINNNILINNNDDDDDDDGVVSELVDGVLSGN